MRKAMLIMLKKQNYYNYFVLILVNNEPIGTGAFFNKLHQALKFIDDCKVKSSLIKHEEDY